METYIRTFTIAGDETDSLAAEKFHATMRARFENEYRFHYDISRDLDKDTIDVTVVVQSLHYVKGFWKMQNFETDGI